MEWKKYWKIFLFTIFIGNIVPVITVKCPCADLRTCDHNAGEPPYGDKEIFMFSRGTTDLSKWRWDSLSTVIVPPSFSTKNKNETLTLCTTHQQNRKFGVTAQVSLTGTLDSTSEETKTWVNSVLTRQSDWHADVVNIDLLPYFMADSSSKQSDHVELVKILRHLKESLHNQTNYRILISCVVPWKPPCAEKTNTCDFSWIALDVCDYFILSGDSFLDFNDDKCRAGATVPFAKLVYGISEYNSHSVPLDRIILGIPWHGYDYVCADITGDDVCLTEKKADNNGSIMKCSFKKERMTLGELFSKHSARLLDRKHLNSELYSAPYFNYEVNGTKHQVWFEDNPSLTHKYRLVEELGLKGIAVFYADDLSSTDHDARTVWTWLAHQNLLETAHKTPEQHDLHTADTVAGVAVACLLIGVLLGVVFACLGLKYRVKKPRHPFRDDGHMDEFMDEDPNL